MLILFIDGSRKIRDVTIIESFQLNRYNVERCKSTSTSYRQFLYTYSRSMLKKLVGDG